ncbi:hypothetical protein AAK894_06610 [Lachnospiraceae bacterium 46-61]
MKMKILAGTVIAAFTLSLGAMSILAAESITNTPNNNVVYHYCGEGCQFIDENGDGICDYYGMGGCYGANQGQCYVDENGDGICDYYGTTGCYGRHQYYTNGNSGGYYYGVNGNYENNTIQNDTNNTQVDSNFVPQTYYNNGGWGRHCGRGCGRR